MASEGELFEIFSWLPAKSIFRFKSVSKACKEVMSDHYFAETQFTKMQVKDESGFIIQPSSCQRYRDKLEFHTLDSEDRSSGVPLASVGFLEELGRVLHSSNGLLLCRDVKTGGFFICNPATQRWLPIDIRCDPGKDLRVVFECNQIQSDPHGYLLMVMEETTEEDWSSDLHCKFFSLEEGPWVEREGKIQVGKRTIDHESHVYQNGWIHFLTDCSSYFPRANPYYWPYIVSYDIKNGTSSFMKLPKSERRGFDETGNKMGIFGWGRGESICLVKLRRGVFSAWVLRDYNSSLWTRILKIRVRAMGMKEAKPIISGFTVFNGKSLLVATEEKVYLYDMVGDYRTRRAKEVCSHGCGDRVLLHSYSSTLRPCGYIEIPLSG
ncbi:hypothetical protein NMG60_11012201 [Bertholletia excelsa]